MTMIVVNIFEAKAKLSEYLDLAAHGERVLICKRNRPVAELHAVESARTTPRPVGLGRGRLTVPPAFFDPLPDALLAGFEGAAQPAPGTAGLARAAYQGGLLRVAEEPPPGGQWDGVRDRRRARRE
jgi:prevent-host-death family protein